MQIDPNYILSLGLWHWYKRSQFWLLSIILLFNMCVDTKFRRQVAVAQSV
jgi:hypothetical protein